MKAILAAVASIGTITIPAIHTHHHPGCPVVYTIAQGERPARIIYSGTRHVTRANFFTLGRMEMCQHTKKDQAIVRTYNHQLADEHTQRVIEANRVWSSAIASWYYDAGTTGCGFHATYGIATFIVPCGGQVILRGPGGEVTATRDDSGPYISGRTFDLDPVTKAALGCGDLCDVQYSIP